MKVLQAGNKGWIPQWQLQFHIELPDRYYQVYDPQYMRVDKFVRYWSDYTTKIFEVEV